MIVVEKPLSRDHAPDCHPPRLVSVPLAAPLIPQLTRYKLVTLFRLTVHSVPRMLLLVESFHQRRWLKRRKGSVNDDSSPP